MVRHFIISPTFFSAPPSRPLVTNAYRHFLFVCLIILFSASVHAEENETKQTANTSNASNLETTQPNIPFIAPLDGTRNVVSGGVTYFANWLDNFFGDERIYEESQNSYLKLDLLEINEEGFQPRFEANLQGKLTLPNTQERLKILLESDPGDGTNSDDTIVEAVENQEQSLGLRYIQYTSDFVRANTDIGVRFKSGVDTFARFRLRGLFYTGQWQLRAAETLFWRDSIGYGSTTKLDVERRYATRYLFRSSSKTTWLDESRQFDMSQNLFLIHTNNIHKAIIYQAGLTAVSKPKLETTGYIVSIRLRQKIHKDWLFFEINPKVLYPQAENFHSRHSLTFKLEVIFGKA